MRKNFLVVLALALLLPCVMMAQNIIPGYGGWTPEDQTRNIPAGSVQDPGSHLTYIVDTGVNARAIFGPAISGDDVTGNVLTDLGLANASGQLDISKVYASFISITNTHPTQAVTVHFRYFNDNCDDVLDFLVVLTCNDTLIFDPFNFEIPGTNGENTRDRIFGPLRPGRVLEPITTQIFGSGRFVITAAASGADVEHTNASRDSFAEILFPNEYRGLSGECNIQQAVAAAGSTAAISARFTDTALTRLETLAGRYNTPKVVNVGTSPGLVDTNLHVFNASQISFDFLYGHLTTAIPATPGTDQVSWGLSAWARPTIDAAGDTAVGLAGRRDGDSYQVETGNILLGTENYRLVTGLEATGTAALTNFFFLRNEVHGGNLFYDSVSEGGFSLYGALGTHSLHPVPDQTIHLLSVQDDYNGSNNAGISTIADRSANISPAFTTYVLQIFDNNEDVLTIPPSTQPPISPPRPGAVLDLKAICFCLRTFLTSTVDADTNVDDITIAELDTFFDVLSPLGDFDGLLVPVAPDQSGGWIRFVRDNTNVVRIVRDATINVNAEIGGPFPSFPAPGVRGVAGGTASVNAARYSDSNNPGGVSFLTIGQHVLTFEGFGASWYLNAAASDARTSENGVETVTLP